MSTTGSRPNAKGFARSKPRGRLNQIIWNTGRLISRLGFDVSGIGLSLMEWADRQAKGNAE